MKRVTAEFLKGIKGSVYNAQLNSGSNYQVQETLGDVLKKLQMVIDDLKQEAKNNG